MHVHMKDWDTRRAATIDGQDRAKATYISVHTCVRMPDVHGHVRRLKKLRAEINPRRMATPTLSIVPTDRYVRTPV